MREPVIKHKTTWRQKVTVQSQIQWKLCLLKEISRPISFVSQACDALRPGCCCPLWFLGYQTQQIIGRVPQKLWANNCTHSGNNQESAYEALALLTADWKLVAFDSKWTGMHHYYHNFFPKESMAKHRVILAPILCTCYQKYSGGKLLHSIPLQWPSVTRSITCEGWRVSWVNTISDFCQVRLLDVMFSSSFAGYLPLHCRYKLHHLHTRKNTKAKHMWYSRSAYMTSVCAETLGWR